jgi:FAD/FMN-containing dehydrogenase
MSELTLVTPSDADYDAARMAWNLTADQRPAAVAFPESADDVAAAVRLARENGWRVAAQAVGHAGPALPPLDDTLLLKTVRMDGVSVDPDARRGRVEAGARWGALAAAAGEHGLSGLSGSSPGVSVVGYSLGGGIGWLGRLHGLAANSIVGADVVTADGERVRADADENTDLFWALRGGGGDFGVVTALELELYPHESAYAGAMIWPADRAAEVLQAYRACVADAPAELSTGFRLMNLPPLPQVPEPLRGRSVVDVTGAYAGDADDGAALLEPLRELGGTIVDGFAEVPASALGTINNDPEDPVPGMTAQTVLSELGEDTAAAILAAAGPGSETPLLAVATRHLGGALGEAPPNAGALGSVEGEHAVSAVGAVMPPERAPEIAEALDRVVESVGSWSTGRDYLNFADRPGDASNAFPDDVYARLRQIKRQVDPDNLFVSAHPIG